MAHYYMGLKLRDEFNNYVERIYKSLFEVLKSELGDIIEKLVTSQISVSFNNQL
jgi:hypothetical protein